MNGPVGEPEQKAGKMAEAGVDAEVDLEAIDRVLKDGLAAIPAEKVSRDSLKA